MAVNSKYKQYKNIIANNDKVASNSIGRTLSNRGLVSPAGLGSAILSQAAPTFAGRNLQSSEAENSDKGVISPILQLNTRASGLSPSAETSQPLSNVSDNYLLNRMKAKANGQVMQSNPLENYSQKTPQAADKVNPAQTNTNINITGTANANAGNSAVVGAVAPTVSGNANMSLAQYIAMAGGVDPNKQYNQSVKSAIADYERQKATYGANAEALAGMGLTNSGTSNYLDQAAYGSMQAAKAQAAAQRDADMTALAGQYINYQAQQEQQRQNTLMEAYNNAIKLGLSGDNMQKYLKAIVPNISQEEIDGLTAADDVVADEVAQNNFAEISQAYASMLEGGSDPNAAKEMLIAQGYNADEVEAAVGAIDKYTADNLVYNQQQVYDRLSPTTSNNDLAKELGLTLAEGQTEYAVEDITNTVDQYVREGALTKEQGEEIKNVAVQRESDALRRKAASGDKNAAMDLFVLADEYGADAVIDQIDDFKYDIEDGILYAVIGGNQYSIGFGFDAKAKVPEELKKTDASSKIANLAEYFSPSEGSKGIVIYNGDLYAKVPIGTPGGVKNTNVYIWSKISDIGASGGSNANRIIRTGSDYDRNDNRQITQIKWDAVKKVLLEKGRENKKRQK